MLKDRPQTQSSLEFVSIDELAPTDHLLRKIEAKVDCSFIHDLVREYYCDSNGRPAFDPTLMFNNDRRHPSMRCLRI
jgi:transposase